jgi:general secretion pathway protein L
MLPAAAGSGAADNDLQGPLPAVARRLPHDATIAVVAPLQRCIVMAVDLPLLQGVKLQQALAGLLGDRLIGTSYAQHYAAGPAEHGRIREAAVCDAAWLKQCLDELAAAGLRVAQVIPEASLLPKAAAWWGQLHADEAPAWLVRAANGEAVRVAPALLEATLPAQDDAQRATWQWFVDPAPPPPPAVALASATALGAAALLRNATAAAARWDLRQFSLAPPDRATRVMRWCANLTRSRSGRFALGALAALLVVNLLGLNLYAMKQQRAIQARHAEMERIVAQALPGVPRLLEPALQLEAAWQRARSGATVAGAGALLGLFAQTGHSQTLTALDITERALRAAFSDSAALERSVAACQSAALSAALQRAGARCVRDADRLLLDFTRDAASTPASR